MTRAIRALPFITLALLLAPPGAAAAPSVLEMACDAELACHHGGGDAHTVCTAQPWLAPTCVATWSEVDAHGRTWTCVRADVLPAFCVLTGPA